MAKMSLAQYMESLESKKNPKAKRKKTAKKSSSSANQITSACIRYLALSGFDAWRQNNVSVYDPKLKRYRSFAGRRGLSDIIGIHKKTGVWCAVEVKAGKDKPSQAQKDFVEMIKGTGAFACIVWSLDQLIEEFKEWESQKNKS